VGSQIKDENNKWAGCDCLTLPPKEDIGDPFPIDDKTLQALLASLAAAPLLNPDSYAKDPIPKDPECFHSRLTAPQRNDTAKDGNPPVQSEIDEWCGKQDGVEVKDIIADHWSAPNNTEFWISANKAPGDGCKDAPKVKKDDCANVLTQSMGVCDRDSGFTGGLSYLSECISYVGDQVRLARCSC
jgi:hypothetical protein